MQLEKISSGRKAISAKADLMGITWSAAALHHLWMPLPRLSDAASSITLPGPQIFYQRGDQEQQRDNHEHPDQPHSHHHHDAAASQRSS
nr:hypothetical protein [Sphingomonas sp. SCN 67-18]